MMRSLPRLLLWLLSLLCGWLLCVSPAWADTLPSTASPTASTLFETHCVGCHVNGGNIVRRRKTLKRRALERNGVDSTDAIAQLITNGKGLMSAYRDRLTAEEVDLLAEYVWQQAENNWQ